MEKPDIRWIQRFNNFIKAFSQLEDGVMLHRERDLSVLEEQGLIQSFEYTHELAWKTLKDFLLDRGNEGIYGSKDAVRASFQTGLIEEGEIWMDMIGSRNDTSHTYNQETAKEVVKEITNRYYFEFKKLREKFEDLRSEKQN